MKCHKKVPDVINEIVKKSSIIPDSITFRDEEKRSISVCIVSLC
ncbi:hypothetical protein J500_1595 [Acinetobacter sp. 479375]|nr:hypothetical protein J500_1595 [Acinetobacter sp. 479375]